jgi:hypothetical protein
MREHCQSRRETWSILARLEERFRGFQLMPKLLDGSIMAPLWAGFSTVLRPKRGCP